MNNITKQVLGLFLAVRIAQAETSSHGPWLFWLPGGGQYLLGQKTEATAYAAGTLGTLGWGIAAQSRKGRGELNAPLIYTQQIYVLSLYSAYRDLILRTSPGKDGPYRRLDPTPTHRLFSAPFERSQLTSPWVIGSAILGAGVGFLAVGQGHPPGNEFNGISRLRYLGNSFYNNRGIWAYNGYWSALSLGAATSEEALFRGMIQTDFEESWGPRQGLWAASALFGLAHLSRLTSVKSWGHVAYAAGAGSLLGWRFQKMDYRLAQPIAMHFWYDAILGVTLFALDPKNNPLGAQVEFKY